MFLIIILPVVMYWYETWSLTFREEHSLRVFDNRKMFGTAMDEVTDHCRRLHSEELHDLWSSPSDADLTK
jgi:hypothetical protein